jgi:hypothetical protein
LRVVSGKRTAAPFARRNFSILMEKARLQNSKTAVFPAKMP